MNEDLIYDYLVSNGFKIYKDCNKITDVDSWGGRVTCSEVSSCGYYSDRHTIDLLDLIAWVYKIRNESL